MVYGADFQSDRCAFRHLCQNKLRPCVSFGRAGAGYGRFLRVYNHKQDHIEVTKMHQVLMRYPGGKPKALTLSYDDGVEQDIRLLAIMRRHGIRGTFNLNSGLFAPGGTVYEAGRIHRRLTGPGVVELFQNSGMEVAVHALTHPFLDSLPMADILQEVVEDRRNLEKLFQKPIQGMAYIWHDQRCRG